MIKLSKRLEAIASFVRDNAKIVDIGCDHAHLDIFLVQHNKNVTAIAVDLREGALKQARKNVSKYMMDNVIDVRLGNGLDVIDKEEIDTVVISGLGCQTIIDILNKGKECLVNVNDLIIQSNNDYYTLRKQIGSLGYRIINEKLVKDKGIIYLVIHFVKGYQKYSHNDYLFGPILRKKRDLLYKEWLARDIEKKEILYPLIPRKYFVKRLQLKNNIFKLKKELK